MNLLYSYGINNKSGFFWYYLEEYAMKIGIDIGGTNVRAGLVDIEGRVVDRVSAKTPSNEEPERLIELIISLCGQLGQAESVGIGAPGLIDHLNGIVRISPNLPKWRDVPLKALLELKLARPVKVANDVNSIAWGEFLFGAGIGSKDMLVITLGTGLGGALILDGKLHLGKSHMAGELGHSTFIKNGLSCPCGKRGCVEQYVAKNAIIRIAREKNPELKEVDPEIVAKAGHKGEKWAIEVYEEIGDNLARVLGGVIQLLNPDRIIVGGQISKAGELLFSPLRRAIINEIQPALRETFEIKKSALGNDAGIIGAAFLT